MKAKFDLRKLIV